MSITLDPASRRTDIPSTGFAVGVGQATQLEVILAHLGDIAEPDQRVAAASEDQLAQVVQVLEAADRAQQVTSLAGFDLAAGGITVARDDRVTHIGDPQIAFGKARGVEQDLDLAFRTAVDADLRYARYALHACLYVVFEEVLHQHHVQLARIARQRRDAEVHEGVAGERGRVDPRLVDVVGIGRHLAQGIGHADQRLVDIDAVGELQLDAGPAERRGGDQSLEARDIAQELLLFDEDLFFHILRGRAGPGGAHRHRAHVEVGDHLHRDAQRRHQPDDGDDQHRHGHQGASTDQTFEHQRSPRIETC